MNAADAVSEPIDSLVLRLDAAVRLGSVEEVTERVKHELSSMIAERRLALPDHYLAPNSERYARHLLHRSDALGYTAVVMVWSPGQRTALHDHSGMWCVEGVVDGDLSITRYEMLSEADGRFRFEECERIAAGAGSSGSLIPPHEYHVLANDDGDRTAVTLHVYGGEMSSCSVFLPQGDGTFARAERQLSYDD